VFPRNTICETSVSGNEKKGWFIILAHATLCEATVQKSKKAPKKRGIRERERKDCRKRLMQGNTKTVPRVKSIEASISSLPRNSL
jgi:hypothetical protein